MRAGVITVPSEGHIPSFRHRLCESPGPGLGNQCGAADCVRCFIMTLLLALLYLLVVMATLNETNIAAPSFVSAGTALLCV
jgi:hypothetical protein